MSEGFSIKAQKSFSYLGTISKYCFLCVLSNKFETLFGIDALWARIVMTLMFVTAGDFFFMWLTTKIARTYKEFRG